MWGNLEFTRPIKTIETQKILKINPEISRTHLLFLPRLLQRSHKPTTPKFTKYRRGLNEN